MATLVIKLTPGTFFWRGGGAGGGAEEQLLHLLHELSAAH